MGDPTDKSRQATITAHQGVSGLAKPVQKVLGTMVVNKENAAPNSVQAAATRPATRGLAARGQDTAHTHTSAAGTASKRSDAHQSNGNHAQTGAESHARATPAHGSRSQTETQPTSTSKPSRVAATASKDTSSASETPVLSASALLAKSDAVFHHLISEEPFKDNIAKWCEYLKVYCEKRSYGFDVLRGVLDLSLQAAKSDMLADPYYFELWRYWASRLPLDDQYEAFKMIENYGIGSRCAPLYISLANLKMEQKDSNGALKALENGLARGAEPRSELESQIDSIRRTHHTGEAKGISTTSFAVVSHGPSSRPPSTPQHVIHMDCDSTPSGHLPSLSAAASSASKYRYTPSTSSKLSGASNTNANGQINAIPGSATPSPSSADTAIAANIATNLSGSNSANNTSSGGAGSASIPSKQRRTVLPTRLGLRGGAQRVPKATSATSASNQQITPSSDSLLPLSIQNPIIEQVNVIIASNDENALERSATLAPIDEDSSVMQVDEPTSAAHGPITAGKSTGPFTASTATSQPYSMGAGTTTGSSLSATSSLSSSTTSSSANNTLPAEQVLPSVVNVSPSTGASLQSGVNVLGTSSNRSSLIVGTNSMSMGSSAAQNTSKTSPRNDSNMMAFSEPHHQQQQSLQTQLPSSTAIQPTHVPSTRQSPTFASASNAPVSAQRSAAPIAQSTQAAPLLSANNASIVAPQPTYVQQQPSSSLVGTQGQANVSAAPSSSSATVQRPPSRSAASSSAQPMAMQQPRGGNNAMNVDPQAAIEAANSAAVALGRELFIIRGRPYINLAAIGKGGTCSVYKVMDMSGGIYALKVITWTNDTLEVVNGYNQEVKLLESVQKSPYVVKLIDSELIATSNTMYILFEFAETDLRRLFLPLKMDSSMAQVHPSGRFATDLDALRYYWRSMLSAVLVLHKARIVHLDLKPANFVLVEGRVKIIDFGIAKKVLNDTMHAKIEDIAGTILYMAPESLRNTSGRGNPHKVGFSADVWSMGCILFQMVFGFTPFEHVQGLMPKIAAITADEPIDIQPVDNEDLMDCLRICLDKNYKNRPTIEDLLNHPFLGGFIRWAQ